MKTLSLVMILIITISGCTTGPLSDRGETVIEMPDGNRLDCKADLETCTKTCDVMYKGVKVKRVYPMKPEKCESP